MDFAVKSPPLVGTAPLMGLTLIGALFHVDHVVQNIHFGLPGTDGFHVKAKNERFTAAGWRFRRTCSTIIFSYLRWLTTVL